MKQVTKQLHVWVTFWVEQIANVLFPPTCLSCGQGGNWLCERCERSFAWLPLGWCGLCGRVGLPEQTTCHRCLEKCGLSTLVGCYEYCGRFERCIRAVKFHPAAVGVGILAKLDFVEERTSFQGTTILIPIPCSPENERRRGFNQAERLALEIARRSPNCTIVNQLHVTRLGRAQVGRSARERRANAAGLYEWRGSQLRGQRCVLIDDVCTTGATLADAARALRTAGARGVQAFVLAQTPARRSRR